MKLLKKFKNSNVIFENYPKKINENYTKDQSSLIINHFKKLQYTEKKYFKKFCYKNKKYLNKKTIFEIKKGKINSNYFLNKIKKVRPDLIVLNATSILSKKFIKSFKGIIINIHAGLIPYYRGAGCNVWTFYNKELEYTGVTIHFVNELIDDGKIILQSQSKFIKTDNTHTISAKCKIKCKIVYRGNQIFTTKS